MSCTACKSPRPIAMVGCTDCEARAFLALQPLLHHEKRCPGTKGEAKCELCVRRLQIARDQAVHQGQRFPEMSPPIVEGVCIHHIQFKTPL